MPCGYCKQGHSLYQNLTDGSVKINCRESEHHGREFPSRDEFQGFLRTRDVAQQLWDRDERLQPSVDYRITPTGTKLFARVNDAVLARPVFRDFIALLDNYHHERGERERITPQQHDEEYRYIDTVLDTPVMDYCYKSLVEDGLFSGDYRRNFRRKLHWLWFKLHGPNLDSCSFEHVFVGEMKHGHAGAVTTGLHNWVQYSRLQRQGQIKYNGRIAQEVDDTDNVLTFAFTWSGHVKDKSSMFIGTTPAFEMALYTYLYFVHSQTDTTELKLGGHCVDVTLHRLGDRMLTAYPEKCSKIMMTTTTMMMMPMTITNKCSLYHG